MDGCLVRYAQSSSADLITMTCIADIGVNLTPHKGIHQVDLHGDFSGYLSAHPKVPLMTFHHFDAMDPIFPNKDRFQSTRHLMKAADADQSRLLQQTICYQAKQLVFLHFLGLLCANLREDYAQKLPANAH
ncbi:UNVERIFIED_CONTAM: hypothetical protein Scaly_0287800 [Sesamum calycinum]|uniref:Uncharacterized protein n=1 Tax=Sesamum calycinum TaxID=2727403 RepID=A0AAW2SAF5_9LAMI